MTEASPFRKLSVRRVVNIPPHELNDVPSAIIQSFNSSIMKYNHKYDGVVLSNTNISFPDDSGAIIDDSPFCRFEATADLVIFSPSIGSKLSGSVVHVSEDHISMLVFGVFNASIPRDTLDTQYKFHETDCCWYRIGHEGSEDPKHYIAMDSVLEFAVKKVYKGNYSTIAIIGDLLQYEPPKEEKPKKEKRKRRSDGSEKKKKKSRKERDIE
ncbi:hypothetical protein P9112_008023 [Eukaryota sp. TZLM1-RC]